MSIAFPGMDWVKDNGDTEILNTLDEVLPWDVNKDGKIDENDKNKTILPPLTTLPRPV